MTARPLTWLDVFTARALSGNGLAVVHDADGLDDATMLAFARETRLSETTFVQSPTGPGADYRTRIFMTRGELPFAGHPSLGTAVAVALLRGEREARYVQETIAGRQPIEVALAADGRSARCSMLQEPAAFGAELDPASVLPAAGLAAADADPALPVQVVSTGVPHVIAPVRAAALDRLAPDAAALGTLLGAHGAVVLYLAAVAGGERVRARSLFLDADGRAAEDPATGSAAGPLMAHLHARAGATALEVEQGVAMGRPSRLTCAIEGAQVRVGGDAVVVLTGRVAL